jgi:hypothetical protein
LNKLQHEAKQKDISVNTLVSHIIRRHIDWYSNAAKAGFVTVRRGLLSNLINRLPENEISSIAEYIAKNETKDFVLLSTQYNIESALDVIETWQICEIYIKWDNDFCPCCGIRLGTRPRTSHYKMKWREMVIAT